MQALPALRRHDTRELLEESLSVLVVVEHELRPHAVRGDVMDPAVDLDALGSGHVPRRRHAATFHPRPVNEIPLGRFVHSAARMGRGPC